MFRRACKYVLRNGFEAVVSGRDNGITGEVAETLAIGVGGFLHPIEFGW
jgi:hypothetical protein